MTVEERVAKLEVKIDNIEVRQDNTDKLVESVGKMAFGIDKLNDSMGRVEIEVGEVKTSVKGLDCRITTVENKPSKLSLKLVLYIAAVVGGYLLNWAIGVIEKSI